MIKKREKYTNRVKRGHLAPFYKNLALLRILLQQGFFKMKNV